MTKVAFLLPIHTLHTTTANTAVADLPNLVHHVDTAVALNLVDLRKLVLNLVRHKFASDPQQAQPSANFSKDPNFASDPSPSCWYRATPLERGVRRPRVIGFFR